MKECISIKTDYSILSSLIKVPDLISYALNNNITTLGIIDDNLSSTIEFINLCEKNNIKPIIGFHQKINNLDIFIYAKNEKGLKSLFKLNTYTLDNDLNIVELTKYIKDLIIIIPYSSRELYKELSKLTTVFIGYLTEDEKVNSLLITNNILYFNIALSLTKEDTNYLNYLNMIKDNLTKEEYQDIDYSHNYLEVNDYSNFTKLIDIKLSTNKNLIPHYDEDIKDSYKYLENLAIKGLYKRLNGNIPDNYKKRLLYELSVIKKMNFVDYFLIVYDYVKYAIKNNILVGPGRGSAAGSLVTYSLGITMIDPLKYGLLFERFLNPERVTMPDIDIDFEYDRREEVIDYCINKYGKKKVAGIITFGTLASRAAIRDVGRVMDIDLQDVDAITKLIDSNI